MSDNMIERVARALGQYIGDGDGMLSDDDQLAIALEAARAAIAAMREPSEQSIADACFAFDLAPAAVRIYWQAMIDAALK